MSRSYSANQYQNAFVPPRILNWEVPLKHRENNWKNRQHLQEMVDQHPRPRQGETVIISTDRGHLLDGVPRSSANPWGNFVGTWDLPTQLPGNTARVTTARAGYAADRLQRDRQTANIVITGKQKNENRQQNTTQKRGSLGPKAAAPQSNQLNRQEDNQPSRSPQNNQTNNAKLNSRGCSPQQAKSPTYDERGYPPPDVSRMSPTTGDDGPLGLGSPVGLPNDRRSPTPPERSPPPVRVVESVVAL